MSDRPATGFPHDSTLPLLGAFMLALAFLGFVVAVMKDDNSGARPVARTTTTRTTPRPAPAATPDVPAVRVTLTVSAAGDGHGMIRIGDELRDCSEEDCRVSFDQGEDATLAARPADDSTFVSWTGSCSSARVCRVRMDRSLSVVALFASDTAAAPTTPDAECSDDFDNDGDGSIDDLDPECAIGDSEFPTETPAPPPVIPQPPAAVPPPPPVVTPPLPQR